MKALIFLLLSLPAFAGVKEVGNGGDLVRLDLVSVRNMIYQNAGEWPALKNAGVDIDALRQKMDEVGTAPNRFILRDKVALLDGVARSAMNRPSVPDIAFNRPFWLAAGANLPAKIGIELHEFLGLLGIEGTDDYRISNAVVNDLRAAHPAFADAPLPSGFLSYETTVIDTVSNDCAEMSYAAAHSAAVTTDQVKVKYLNKIHCTDTDYFLVQAGKKIYAVKANRYVALPEKLSSLEGVMVANTPIVENISQDCLALAGEEKNTPVSSQSGGGRAYQYVTTIRCAANIGHDYYVVLNTMGTYWAIDSTRFISTTPELKAEEAVAAKGRAEAKPQRKKGQVELCGEFFNAANVFTTYPDNNFAQTMAIFAGDGATVRSCQTKKGLTVLIARYPNGDKWGVIFP